MAITDEQKADTLNKHYHQVFTKEDDTDTPTLEPRGYTNYHNHTEGRSPEEA